MSTILNIRLPDEINEELENVMKETDRDKTYIVKKALINYFKENAGYQIAMDRLNDKDDRIISLSEMEELLDD